MSRKYRHNGYQDSDRDESRERSGPPQRRDDLTPEERIQRRSLRHATAQEANEVIRCHHCGCNIQNFGTIVEDSSCPHCRALLHCCRTCRSFDSASRWQCRAEIDTAISDKSKANDCVQYGPRVVLDTTGRRSSPAVNGNGSGSPKDQFESLFKR
jgi:hypothetical protein